ncbi:hypothetical protein B0A55_05613 [Friedmanniomyces simplex]|uniref:Uncharacterized protein n=1 Tax=Friedmanniomyces simplex TaxID=329884 RepID=A0A4U0X277_9PEZI|nr:hypothetical protein B0A55_05613 [Friedmanniomyces simplex]
MAEPVNELLAIEVDADDYAETAAHDTPAVSRTFQSEADFQAQKDAYSARIDLGDNYQRLLEAVPFLKPDSSSTDRDTSEASLIRLGKKDGQLLAYAVGELYYDKRFRDIIQLSERVRLVCETDDKTAESLRRWTRRCEERLQPSNGNTTVTSIGEHARRP